MFVFPTVISSNTEEQIAYLHRAEELLRLEHNAMGERTRLSPDDPNYLSMVDFQVWQTMVWERKDAGVKAELARRKEDIVGALPDPKLESAFASANEARKVAHLLDRYDGDIDVTALPLLGEGQQFPDPNENLLTFTEIDTYGRITVTSSKWTFVGAINPAVDGLRKDCGVDALDGWRHLFEWYINLNLAHRVMPWGCSNSTAMGYDAGGPIMYHNSNDATVFAGVNEGGSYGVGFGLSYSTINYMKVIRAAGNGTISTYNYSDSNRTVLQSSGYTTMSPGNHKFRYFKTAMLVDGSASDGEYGQNFDLGLGYYGAIFKRFSGGSWKKTKLDVAESGVFNPKRFKVFLRGAWQWVDATEDPG
jgi:hypothetical protein